MDVTGKTSLTAYHTPSAYLGATSESCLCRHNGVFTHFAVVSYLNEVVEFDTLVNNGTTHSRAVNTGVGTNLYVVLDDDVSYLRYLVVVVSIRSETEAVSTYHSASMQGYTITYLTTMINSNVGVNGTALANLYIVANVSERTYVGVLANLCGRRNESKRVDTCLTRHHALVEL